MSDLPVFRVSREMLHLAAEHGAAEATRRYVEGAFKDQFPNMNLELPDVTFDFSQFETTNLDVPGIRIEWED